MLSGFEECPSEEAGGIALLDARIRRKPLFSLRAHSNDG